MPKHKKGSNPHGNLPSPKKAKEILKDGEVRGKPLTRKQRGLMGAQAGKK